MSNSTPKKRFSLSLFEQMAIAISSLLGIAILVLWWQTPPQTLKVNQFSWEKEKIGVQDQFFTLTFNHPVDQSQVEETLTIDPNLKGHINWHHNTLFYTLTELPIYGTNYQIKLPNIPSLHNPPLPSQPFVNVVSTRDRAFVYIGVQGEERGRLILLDITDTDQLKKTILTPRDLIVTDFEIYPDGDRILFLGYEPTPRNPELSRKHLFTVTTGLPYTNTKKLERAGRLQKILEAKDYQNLRFDLSDNGQTIVVLRQNLQNPAELGLWVIPEQGNPRPLGLPSQDFVVSPNGKTVTVKQNEGISILPLTQDAGNSQFLSQYEKSLGFTLDDRQQLLVRVNNDYTRSLVLLDQNNQTTDLVRTIHPIIDCQFDPRQTHYLYCLKIDLIPQENGQYREEPFLSLMNVKTGQDIPLLALPNYPEVQLSMSPDGIILLFDQVITQTPRSGNDLLTPEQKAIVDGQIWGFPLPDLANKKGDQPLSIVPKALESGYQPQWIP